MFDLLDGFALTPVSKTDPLAVAGLLLSGDAAELPS